jgi:hypothetical protein
MEANLPNQIDHSEKDSEYLLEPKYTELLNILSSYVDFYDANVDIKSDSKIKFTYAIHVLNHALK